MDEKRDMPKTMKALAAVHALARVKGFNRARADRVEIFGDCYPLLQTHAKRPRILAHAFHYWRVICVCPEVENLPPEKIAGIIAHEFGHVMCDVRDEGSAEAAADTWLFDNLGLTIRYDPEDTLEFLDNTDMEKLLLG